MTTLRIYDLRDGRVLALDMRDLIDLLAPRSLESSWTVSPVSVEYPTLGRTFDEFMVTGQGGDQLESLAASGSLVSGLIIPQYAHPTHQGIWGQFVATPPQHTHPCAATSATVSTFSQ